MTLQKTDYPAIGETLYTATLPNGMPIYVLPKPGYRKTFAALAVNYGGADRRLALDGREMILPAGTAHYLEHKMFETRSGDALLAMSAAGADPNAFTDQSMTVYHFECTGRFEENLRTLLSFVSEPYFPRESVDRERSIIAQEIRMYEDSPDFAVYLQLMRCLFARSPLRDSVAGTVESIADITPELLYDCHRVFYHPSNLALCVVGDADPAAAAQIALEHLPGGPAEPPVRDYGPAESLAPVSPLWEGRMEVAAPLFMIGAKLGPARRGPEALREQICSGLALRCLGGRSSPFYLKQYREGFLNAAFGSDVEQAAGQRVVSFDGETSKEPQAILDALTEEIRRVSAGGFDPALFQRQKRASLGGRIRALASFSGLAVSMIHGCFAGFQPLDAFAAAETVTADDAAAWVRDNLIPERLAMSVIYPKED